MVESFKEILDKRKITGTLLTDQSKAIDSIQYDFAIYISSAIVTVVISELENDAGLLIK